jgi:hypothetical protein
MTSIEILGVVQPETHADRYGTSPASLRAATSLTRPSACSTGSIGCCEPSRSRKLTADPAASRSPMTAA